MAKKRTTRKTTRVSRVNYNVLPSMSARSSGMRSETSREDLLNFVREIISSPTVRYVSGGIAAAVLAQLATKLSGRYPEISNFIRENVDSIESELSKIRSHGEESVRH